MSKSLKVEFAGELVLLGEKSRYEDGRLLEMGLQRHGAGREQDGQ